MIDPARLLTQEIRPSGVLTMIAGAVVLLILSAMLYAVVGAWLDFMVEALEPGLVFMTGGIDEASIAGLAR